MKRSFIAIITLILLLSFVSCDYASLPGSEGSTKKDNELESRPDAEIVGTLAEKMSVPLYDNEGIKVTAVSFYTDTDDDLILNCDIINNSSDNIFVALEYPEINGICSTVSEMWADVKEGESINANLEIGADFLELAEITTVASLAVRFNIYNENYRVISDEENKYIAFTTENADYEQIIDKKGTAVIDENDHKIIVGKSSEGKDGLDVRVCYVNDSERILSYNITDAVIGDKVFYVEAPAELPPYSMTYIKFTVFSSDLNREGISIEDITEMDITASVANVLGETVSECSDETVEF